LYIQRSQQEYITCLSQHIDETSEMAPKEIDMLLQLCKDYYQSAHERIIYIFQAAFERVADFNSGSSEEINEVLVHSIGRYLEESMTLTEKWHQFYLSRELIKIKVIHAVKKLKKIQSVTAVNNEGNLNVTCEELRQCHREMNALRTFLLAMVREHAAFFSFTNFSSVANTIANEMERSPQYALRDLMRKFDGVYKNLCKVGEQFITLVKESNLGSMRDEIINEMINCETVQDEATTLGTLRHAVKQAIVQQLRDMVGNLVHENMNTNPLGLLLQIQAAEQITRQIINDDISNYLAVPFHAVSILGIYHTQDKDEEESSSDNANMPGLSMSDNEYDAIMQSLTQEEMNQIEDLEERNANLAQFRQAMVQSLTQEAMRQIEAERRVEVIMDGVNLAELRQEMMIMHQIPIAQHIREMLHALHQVHLASQDEEEEEENQEELMCVLM